MLLLLRYYLFGTLIIFVFYTGRDEIDENTVILSALIMTVLALLLSLIVWFVFDNNCKYFQSVQEQYTIGHSNFYLGLDSFSVYFILLTTLTNIGEHLYNAYLSNCILINSILITNTLYVLLISVLIPIIGFLYLALIKILDIYSALLLVWVATIFTYILYINIVYNIGYPYILFYLFFLYFFYIYISLLPDLEYYELKLIIFILNVCIDIYIYTHVMYILKTTDKKKGQFIKTYTHDYIKLLGKYKIFYSSILKNKFKDEN